MDNVSKNYGPAKNAGVLLVAVTSKPRVYLLERAALPWLDL